MRLLRLLLHKRRDFLFDVARMHFLFFGEKIGHIAVSHVGTSVTLKLYFLTDYLNNHIICSL